MNTLHSAGQEERDPKMLGSFAYTSWPVRTNKVGSIQTDTRAVGCIKVLSRTSRNRNKAISHKQLQWHANAYAARVPDRRCESDCTFVPTMDATRVCSDSVSPLSSKCIIGYDRSACGRDSPHRECPRFDVNTVRGTKAKNTLARAQMKSGLGPCFLLLSPPT